MKNKGAMELSFGMIFSIILIIAFVVFAFWGIKKFIDLQKTAQVGVFIDDFKNDVDRVWKSSQSSEKKTYSLPSKIEKVCFSENSEIYFEPPGSGGNFDYMGVEHINVQQPSSGNFCVSNIKGKVYLTLKKSFDENLVNVSR
ncbi:MAG: hypothetical protein AABW63_03770 [Nanoarchaeota archaeon]|mgnify:CR=1 FL=1